MKTTAKISAATLFLSVMCAGSSGPWAVMAIVAGAASMGVLFYSSWRLGHFYTPAVTSEAVVVSLEDARENRRPSTAYEELELRLRVR